MLLDDQGSVQGALAPRTARYVLVFFTGLSGTFLLGDLEVIDAATGVNLVAGKAVGSFTTSGAGTLAGTATNNLGDGNAATIWQANNANYNGAWVQVDLGASYNIHSVNLKNLVTNKTGSVYVFSGDTLLASNNTAGVLGTLQAAANLSPHLLRLAHG